MKLYVKNITREPNDTLYTFLCKVLRLDGEYWGQSSTDATYLDPEFTKLQCVSGKNRSFDDLVYICKTYFRSSDKSIAKVIKRILDENNSFLLIFCDNINKWVLNKNLNKSNTIKYCGTYNKSNYYTDKSGKRYLFI